MDDLRDTLEERIAAVTEKNCQTDDAVWPTSSGGYDAQAFVVPYPAAGFALIDFLIVFKKPVKAIYYDSLNQVYPNMVAFSPQPAGIDLNRAAVALNSVGILKQFDANYLYIFDVPISQIYISAKGVGTGGNVTIVGANGFRGVFQT